jgi:hypothetical protein
MNGPGLDSAQGPNFVNAVGYRQARQPGEDVRVFSAAVPLIGIEVCPVDHHWAEGDYNRPLLYLKRPPTAETGIWILFQTLRPEHLCKR